jgi:CDP-glucose 4,6-dehydratase
MSFTRVTITFPEDLAARVRRCAHSRGFSAYLASAAREKLLREGKKYSSGWNFGPAAYENYTVGDVVDQVKKNISSINIIAPKQTEKLHEAGLLKLDITKAVNQLQWKPKLNFEQTIKFTTDGYEVDMKKGSDVYSARVEQIKNYCTY